MGCSNSWSRKISNLVMINWLMYRWWVNRSVTDDEQQLATSNNHPVEHPKRRGGYIQRCLVFGGGGGGGGKPVTIYGQLTAKTQVQPRLCLQPAPNPKNLAPVKEERIYYNILFSPPTLLTLRWPRRKGEKSPWQKKRKEKTFSRRIGGRKKNLGIGETPSCCLLLVFRCQRHHQSAM